MLIFSGGVLKTSMSIFIFYECFEYQVKFHFGKIKQTAQIHHFCKY